MGSFILGNLFAAALLVIVMLVAFARKLQSLVVPTIAENTMLKTENARLRDEQARFAAKPYVIGFNDEQISTLASMIKSSLNGYSKPN